MKPRQDNVLRGIILDMDGVLWRGDEPIGDLPAIFERFHQLGLKAILATNNSTRTIQMYVDRLAGFGVPLENWQVINSSQAVAHYLHTIHPQGGPVYILGEIGLIEALEEEGFYHAETGVLAVVVGMDRQVNYQKLSQATLLIRSGAPFIGTNPDRTFPIPEGLIPGTGAILAFIETAAYVSPILIGKPRPAMYEVCLERFQMQPSEVLVVGDRLETDLAGAQAIGCRAAVVLSGVSTPEQVAAWLPQPDWVAADLTALVDVLEQSVGKQVDG